MYIKNITPKKNLENSLINNKLLKVSQHTMKKSCHEKNLCAKKVFIFKMAYNGVFANYGPRHVFKKCISMKNNHICILMLKKPIDHFWCNESRQWVTNYDMAKFRCNGLSVSIIYDSIENVTLDEILHLNRNSNTVTHYKVNTFIKPDGFDCDLQRVCGKGIHYFLTLEAAKSYSFYWGCCIVDDKKYDENGNRIDYNTDLVCNVVLPVAKPTRSSSPPSRYSCWTKHEKYNGTRLCKPSKKSEPKPTPSKIFKITMVRNINQPFMRHTRPRYRGCVKS
jgi:hypothetical protein